MSGITSAILINQKVSGYKKSDTLQLVVFTFYNHKPSYIKDVVVELYSNHSGTFQKLTEGTTDKSGRVYFRHSTSGITVPTCQMYVTMSHSGETIQSNFITCNFVTNVNTLSVKGNVLGKGSITSDITIT